MRDAVIDRELDRPGAGPVWVGGFAFASRRRRELRSGPRCRPALLVLPELSLARAAAAGRARRSTSSAGPATTDRRARPHGAAHGWSASSRSRCRSPTPTPPADTRSRASLRRATTCEAVARGARAAIRAGELEKVVLAREVRVTRSRRPSTRPPSSTRLRSAYPELLLLLRRHARGRVRRRQPGAAGAARGRGRQHRRAGRLDPAQRRPGRRRPSRPAAAARAPRTARSTRSSCDGSSARSRRCRSGWRRPTEPTLIKVANIQHLATPVRAQLARAAQRGRARRRAAPDAGGRRRALEQGAAR